MEVGLTFGSLGDIIALCNIALELTRVLGAGTSDAGRSAREYQSLHKDVDHFAKVLTLVVETYQQRESSPSLRTLDVSTKEIIEDCAGLMQEALDKLRPRYHEYLQSGGSGSKIRGAFKKVEWSVREQQRVHVLQEKIRQNSDWLNTLISLTTQRSARVDNATLVARIAEVQDLVAKQGDETKSLLGFLQRQESASSQQLARLGAVESQLVSQQRDTGALMTLTSGTSATVLDIKEMLAGLVQTVADQQVSASYAHDLRFLDPTREMPVIFEDTLGRQFTLPLEYLKDWGVLYNLIEAGFRNRKSYLQVLLRCYFLEEDRSGDRLDDSKPLSLSLRRGMKVNMAMCFIYSMLFLC
ncbi:hypothetical protein F4778DRAFT_217661 [Xylariomycetidae sp. FL2044]|nr:hypothetical protein F4778DRAFT_217661 [Xylariomycetidae sp. FL2044]